MRRVEVLSGGVSARVAALATARTMTTHGFTNPLPSDEGPAHSADSARTTPAGPPNPKGTSPHSKHVIKEEYKWQETAVSYNAPSQARLRGSFSHQYLPNATPEIPNYVVDEATASGPMSTARNAALDSGEQRRGTSLGEWLKATRGPGGGSLSPSPFQLPSSSPPLPGAEAATTRRVGQAAAAASHPSLSHPGLSRRRLEEEHAAFTKAKDEAVRDAIVAAEQRGLCPASDTGDGPTPVPITQHRDLRGEVVESIVDEFYDPRTGALKENTGSATASEQAIRAKLFDRNAGFAFRTSAGSTAESASTGATHKNMVLDKGVEEEIILARRKAALGIGELGIRERVKKLEEAEREYENELTPQGRDAYRKAKLDAALLAENTKQEEAQALERRLRALMSDDDHSSFERLRSSRHRGNLAPIGRDEDIPQMPPPRADAALSSSQETPIPQLQRATEGSPSGRNPISLQYADQEELMGRHPLYQTEDPSGSDEFSTSSVFAKGLASSPRPDGLLNGDDVPEEMATPFDLISEVRAGKQYPVATSVPKTFSFHAPHERSLGPGDFLASFDPVPNNAPVPQAPMWSSSLSVPLKARRILQDNWRDPQISSGEVSEGAVRDFQSWMEGVCPQLKEDRVFAENILVKPRQMYTKGLYARRRFKKGEVIATMPILQYSTHPDSGVQKQSSPFGSHLSIEALLRHSDAVKARNVPPISAMHYVFAKKETATRDTELHPLFEEQLYLAMLVACEKDAADKRQLGGEVGEANGGAFGPYFDTISKLVVDDEYIRELHREAVEPHQGLEYLDHEGRIDNYIRRIQRHWPDAPHFETLRWAVRFVISRQRMLPLRDDFLDQRADVADDENAKGTLSKGRADEVWGGGPGKGVLQVEEDSLDWLSRFQRWVRETALSALLPAKAVAAAQQARIANDRHVVPTVVPLIDMLMHDYRGVGSVVVEQVKGGASPGSSRVVSTGYSFLGEGVMTPEEQAEETRLQANPPSADAPREDFSMVLRANRDIEVGEELTMVYPKCYSVSYTMFKYGFLALRPRSLDSGVLRQQWGEEGPLRTDTTALPRSAHGVEKSQAS